MTTFSGLNLYLMKSGILCCSMLLLSLRAIWFFCFWPLWCGTTVCLYFCTRYLDTCVFASWGKHPWLLLQNATCLSLGWNQPKYDSLSQAVCSRLNWIWRALSGKMAGLWPKRSTTFGFDCLIVLRLASLTWQKRLCESLSPASQHTDACNLSTMSCD